MDIKNLYSSKSKSEIAEIFSSKGFRSWYHFAGKLGAIYSKRSTKFRVWSPVAKNIYVELYKRENQNDFNLIGDIKLIDLNGIFEVDVNKDLDNIYYKYRVETSEGTYSVVDIYAKSVSVNGEYGLILDVDRYSPNGWDEDKAPTLESIGDSVLYEMHVRDFTIDENSGVINKGKFIGLVEGNSKVSGTDIASGIDHLKELGVTHVHLLPVYDYETVDEKSYNSENYNWGYDPLNYNALEGSYSTNSHDGLNRVVEFKEMVMKFHEAGIRVVMDVVYNHTYRCDDSNFNRLVPQYYYRQNCDGSNSNGSGCGNELATERSMVRKFIVDSIIFYAKKYHIDGFRFDLMGLYDTKTLRKIRDEVNEIDESIIIYGEGWTGGGSALAIERQCLKTNTFKYEGRQIALFNDEIRDGIKGNTFRAEDKGFVSGLNKFNNEIKIGIAGGINIINSPYHTWADSAMQVINYESAHDNYTLWDKLIMSNDDAAEDELIRMNKLGFAIIITAQGIPFIHSGEEFLRTKKSENGVLEHNSYNMPDSINKIDWNRKKEYIDVFNYYKDMITFRKNHKCFRLENFDEIKSRIKFNDDLEAMISFTVDCNGLNDVFKKVLVIHNGNKDNISVNIPAGDWVLISDGSSINEDGIKIINGECIVYKQSCFILAVK